MTWFFTIPCFAVLNVSEVFFSTTLLCTYLHFVKTLKSRANIVWFKVIRFISYKQDLRIIDAFTLCKKSWRGCNSKKKELPVILWIKDGDMGTTCSNQLGFFNLFNSLVPRTIKEEQKDESVFFCLFVFISSDAWQLNSVTSGLRIEKLKSYGL